MFVAIVVFYHQNISVCNWLNLMLLQANTSDFLGISCAVGMDGE